MDSRSTHRGRWLAGAFVLAVAVAALPFAARPANALTLPNAPIGLSRLLIATTDATTVARGIATFGGVPSAGQVAALKGLGLAVQPMRHVPLALVVGPGLGDAGGGHQRRRCRRVSR